MNIHSFIMFVFFQARRGRGQHARLVDDAQPNEAGAGDDRHLLLLRLPVVRGVHEEGK